MASFICTHTRESCWSHTSAEHLCCLMNTWRTTVWWIEVCYPVQHVSPAFHSDALEHSQHGKEEVVKVGDSSVGTIPPSPTLWAVNVTLTTMASECTWYRVVLHKIIWKITKWNQMCRELHPAQCANIEALRTNFSNYNLFGTFKISIQKSSLSVH